MSIASWLNPIILRVVDSVKVEDYKGYVIIENFALIFNMGQSVKFVESAHRVEDAIKDESQKTRDVVKEESQKTRECEPLDLLSLISIT